jgi:hypothetical protein
MTGHGQSDWQQVGVSFIETRAALYAGRGEHEG